MPYWGEHLLIANKIINKLEGINKKIDKNLFIFGNILPDVQDGYVPISKVLPHKVNHYYLNEKYSILNDNHKEGYENFYDIYSSKMKEPVISGYWSHLVTDSLWNKMFYREKCITEKNKFIGYINKDGKLVKGDKEKLRKWKQQEFETFQYYLYRNYEIDIPEYSKGIVEKANIIDVITINDEDVKKVIENIEMNREKAINFNNELQIFTIKELEEQLDKTAEFIFEFLKKKVNL